jgi:hypothetical protein
MPAVFLHASSPQFLGHRTQTGVPPRFFANTDSKGDETRILCNAHIPRHLRGPFSCVFGVHLLIPKSLRPELLRFGARLLEAGSPAYAGRPRQDADGQAQLARVRPTKDLAGKLRGDPRRGRHKDGGHVLLHFSAAVRIKEEWGVFERVLGRAKRRKLRAAGSEHGVEKRVNMNLPARVRRV